MYIIVINQITNYKGLIQCLCLWINIFIWYYRL